jgi:hypothetical protein
MTTTSTMETNTFRTSLGVEIVTGEETPARLPGEGRPHPAHRLLAEDAGEYFFVGLRGRGGPSDPEPVPRCTPPTGSRRRCSSPPAVMPSHPDEVVDLILRAAEATK